MKNPPRRPSIFFNIILFMGLVAIWIAFAPVKIGGQASYVMVSGISMEPDYHTGDLVLVRKAQTYQVGDVVTYRDAQMGSYVIHRIIGIEQELFVMKGDNNSWIDSYHPTQAEIIGKKWIHAPKLGSTMQWFRTPFNLSLAVILLGGVLMSSVIPKLTKGQKGKKRTSINRGGILEGTLYLLGILFLGFLGLSIFAFTRPSTRTAATTPYQQDSSYYYSATGTPGVYDTEMVRTGEPVFPRLACFLNIGHTYTIQGAQLQDISGSQQMFARVMDEPSGWQRTIPLIPQTAFTGNSYFTVAALDLCQLEALVNLVEKETGLHTNTYTVEIVTNIAFTANASGQPITDTFDPILAFKYDKVHLYLANTNDEIDSMHTTKEGLAGSSNVEANTLPLLGWEFTVDFIRVFAVIGLGISFSGLVIIGLFVFKAARQSEEALIRLRYGALLVEVYEKSLEPTSTIIDVTSIDDLAKLAERQGTMILHMTVNSLPYYLVQGNGTTYRYVVGNGKKSVAETGPVQNEIAEHAVYPEEEMILDLKPVHNQVPAYMISHENNAVNTQPIRNITIEHILRNNEKNTIKFEPVQNEISEPTVSQDENKAINNVQAVQQDVIEYLFNSNKNDLDKAKPVHGEKVQYFINSGEIEFVMSESEETKILRKIRL